MCGWMEGRDGRINCLCVCIFLCYRILGYEDVFHFGTCYYIMISQNSIQVLKLYFEHDLLELCLLQKS
jgi:hypothetical protein